jgi:transcriptional regulator with XRE-family HTH domain
MTIGPTIKRLRKERKLSSEALGKIAYVSGATIRGIETGKSAGTLNTVSALAKAFGLRTSELVRLAEEESAL